MTRPTEQMLIDRLAAEATPVRPLRHPLARAGGLLLAFAVIACLALAVLADPAAMLARYVGREVPMVLEVGAMLATAALSITAAFFLSVPGSSRRWTLAPLPPLLLWLGLSGADCVGAAMRGEWGHWAPDCLIFILGAGFAAGVPLLWRLSRARPIDPLPVALLGGLGSAAFAAFLLNFFHPFAITPLDLAIHVAAVLIVIAASVLARRAALRPA